MLVVFGVFHVLNNFSTVHQLSALLLYVGSKAGEANKSPGGRESSLFRGDGKPDGTGPVDIVDILIVVIITIIIIIRWKA